MSDLKLLSPCHVGIEWVNAKYNTDLHCAQKFIYTVGAKDVKKMQNH